MAGSASQGGAGKPAMTLTVSEDRMQILLDTVVEEGKLDQLVVEMRASLHGMGISSGPVLDEAAKRFAAAAEGQTEVSAVVVVEGRKPKPPEDGRIKWTRDFFATGFYVDPDTGVADYRRKLAESNVEEGDLLATVIPPRPGEEGTDVFGKSVPPRQPRPAAIRAGRNVRADEGVGAYYASKAGRIRFLAGIVSVDDVLSIQGSVGLATGHIDHPGSLSVEDNIQSDSQVKASGDIEVRGYIEDAIVECGGNLTVHGGITGGPGCKIRVGGSVMALFIANADLEAEGDVTAKREIDQCTLKTRGRVEVESGRIAGGFVSALGGITAERLGTDSGVRTTVEVGKDFRLLGAIDSRTKELEETKRQVKAITDKVLPFKAKLDKLSPQAKEMVTKLLVQLKSLSSRQKELEAELDTLRTDTDARRCLEVNVRREITEDVSISIRRLTMITKQSYQGPLKAAIVDGDIRLKRDKLRR